MSAGILTTIHPIAEGLFNIKDKLASAHRTRRQAVAEYCENIAKTADKMLRMLKANTVPHEPSAKMRVYEKQLPAVTKGLLSKQQLASVSYWIKNTGNDRELLASFQDPALRAYIEQELTEAAGTLRALAESLRAKG